MLNEIGPHLPVTQVWTAAQGQPRETLGMTYSRPDPGNPGRLLTYRFVKFKDSVTYTAGMAVVYASADFDEVTNDFAGGSAIGGTHGPIAAGIFVGESNPGADGFGYILVEGEYASVDVTGTIAVGERLSIDADGSVVDGHLVAAETAIDVTSTTTVAETLDTYLNRYCAIATSTDTTGKASAYVQCWPIR